MLEKAGLNRSCKSEETNANEPLKTRRKLKEVLKRRLSVSLGKARGGTRNCPSSTRRTGGVTKGQATYVNVGTLTVMTSEK